MHRRSVWWLHTSQDASGHSTTTHSPNATPVHLPEQTGLQTLRLCMRDTTHRNMHKHMTWRRNDAVVCRNVAFGNTQCAGCIRHPNGVPDPQHAINQSTNLQVATRQCGSSPKQSDEHTARRSPINQSQMCNLKPANVPHHRDNPTNMQSKC